MANLVTLQQYKDFAGIKGLNEDAKINVIIPAISQAVKTYCGVSFVDFVSSDKTDFFDITEVECWNSCDSDGRVVLLRHLIELLGDPKVRVCVFEDNRAVSFP